MISAGSVLIGIIIGMVLDLTYKIVNLFKLKREKGDQIMKSVNITNELHSELKQVCKKQKVAITNYVTKLIIDALLTNRISERVENKKER